MENPQSSEIVPKGNVSQMDAQIGKKIEKQEKKIKTKLSAGPMGVTDVSKRRLRINIPPSVQVILLVLAECLIIGCLINIMFYNFGFRFGLINIAGWSVCWWLVKFKLPEAWGRYR